ncbi:hypothetical protein TIFTF001_030140 [Ficus carica]|uniref:Uncharacterized protein n=1 Tax=Ficus carica TaxID=3494 RepID=A0AA88DST9_FICCA|nr:hypothetical protein TIFTF001_030140 [Ficus carica]
MGFMFSEFGVYSSSIIVGVPSTTPPSEFRLLCRSRIRQLHRRRSLPFIASGVLPLTAAGVLAFTVVEVHPLF